MASNSGSNKSLLPAKNMSYKRPRTFSEIVDVIVRDLKARNNPRSRKFVTEVLHEFFNKVPFSHLFIDQKPVYIKGLGKFVKKNPIITLKPNKLTQEFEKKVKEINTQQRRNNYTKAIMMSKEAWRKKKEARLARLEKERKRKEQIEEDKKLNNSYFFY